MSASEDATTPGSTRSTRNCAKCNQCGRVYRNSAAMAVHVASMHNIGPLKATKTTSVQMTTASESDIAKISQQATKPKHIVRSKQNIPSSKDTISTTPSSGRKPPITYSKHSIGVKQVSKAVTRKVPVVNETVNADKSEDINVYNFKCPKCGKVYETFIKAYRHIQKEHPFNKLGERVDPDSAELIQPIKLKIKKVVQEDKTDYQCNGCTQTFGTMKTFLGHLSGLHTQEIDSLFFTTSSGFLRWKQELEAETKITYRPLEDHNSGDGKQYFLCSSRQGSGEAERSKLCPSAIVTQDYKHGRQIHFYRQHAGHTCRPYTLHQKYQKNSLSNYLRCAPDPSHTEGDLYVQFKSLMKSLIFEAAHVDKQHLKKLHEKALDMAVVITEYAEKHLSDDERVEVKKEKVDTPVAEKKIVQLLESSDEEVKEPRSSERLRRKLETPVQVVEPSKRTKRSVTFCDTSANDNVTPKIVSSFSLKDDEGKQSPVAGDSPSNGAWFAKSPTFTFNDTYKNFVENNFKPMEIAPKKYSNTKKERIRTQLGMFKPGLNRSKSIDSVSPVKSNNSSPKVVKVERYEVKEQDNDCNILILKI